MSQHISAGPRPALASTASYLPWLMLPIILIAQIGQHVGFNATSPVSPLIQEDFGITRAQVGLLASVMSVGGLVLMVVAGWVADRIGARLLIGVGPVMVGVFVALSTRATDYWQVVVALLFAGAGMGLTSPAASRAVISWFSPSTRGTAMGIKQTGSSVGGVITATILPGLALYMGWRDAVGIAGLAIIAAGAVTYALYRDPPRLERSGGVQTRPNTRQVLTGRDMQLCYVVGACFAGLQVILAAYLVLYLKEAAAVALPLAGMLLAATQASGAVARLVLGVVSDRMLGGRRKGVLLGVGVTATVLGCVAALFGPLLPMWALAALFIAFGFVGIGWTGILVILTAELAGKEAAGLGAGAGMAASAVGGSVLPPLFGLVADVTNSYQLAWAFAGLIAAIGTVAMFLVRERKDWQPKPSRPAAT